MLSSKPTLAYQDHDLHLLVKTWRIWSPSFGSGGPIMIATTLRLSGNAYRDPGIWFQEQNLPLFKKVATPILKKGLVTFMMNNKGSLGVQS